MERAHVLKHTMANVLLRRRLAEARFELEELKRENQLLKQQIAVKNGRFIQKAKEGEKDNE
ncbi:hypothetical protein P4631_07800 [Halalkalibacterium halodurans]|uniref:hypothetical protein n=1 Tax=Halalkalibacterium halodurans TaxID=86665 RepID=UPI002E2079E2|nr:hypothetical protein [Halalkalibacterium halodurans]